MTPSKGGTNAYMEMLVKETVTLHKVLSKYLTGPTVEVRDICIRLQGLVVDRVFPFLFPFLVNIPLRTYDRPEQFVMSQVLAAINHRLSDEFGKIELGSQEAKDRYEGLVLLILSYHIIIYFIFSTRLLHVACRMIMDVRYFYEKLGELKHVGERGTMLETVVLEKPVAGVAPSQSRLNAKLAAVVAGAGVVAERGPVPGV